MEKKKDFSIYLYYYIILLIIGTLWLLINSDSTSPLLPDFLGYDTALFRTIGKAWSIGEIPYADMFDH